MQEKIPLSSYIHENAILNKKKAEIKLPLLLFNAANHVYTNHFFKSSKMDLFFSDLTL